MKMTFQNKIRLTLASAIVAVAGLALTATSADADTLINSTFEGSLGSWTAGSGSSLYTFSSGTNYASSGTGAANIPKSSGIITLSSALPLLTQGYTSVTVAFKHKWQNGTTTRRLYVQYAPDGVTFGNLAYVTSGSASSVSVTLNVTGTLANAVTVSSMNEDSTGYSGAAFTNTAKFRFVNVASATADVRAYVDDVVITATPNYVPPASITLTGTLGVVDTTYGTASTPPTSFTVSGAALTGAPSNLTVTPPSGYEVSLSSGAGYSTSLLVPYTTATLASTTIYVRLAATAGVAGSPYSGNISVAGGGATTKTIATVSSAVAPKALTVTATGPLKPFGTALTAGTSTTDFVVSGLVNGETVTEVTLTPDGAGLSDTTPLGDPYVVTPSDAIGAGGFLTGNYAITYNPYNGTVGTSILSVTNSPQTYTGSPQAATVTNPVPGTVSNVMYDGSSTVPTNAGTYAVTADFTPTDPVAYSSLTGAAAGNFVIEKATPTATLAVDNSPATYDNSAKSATVGITASSVPGAVANILTGGAASQTNANTYAVTADFVPTDTVNYNPLVAQAAGDFVIQKATPTATLAVSNSPVIYSGSAQAATVSVTVSSVPGTAANILTGGSATQTNANTYAVTVDFVPTDTANYNSLTAQPAGNFVIEKADQTISFTLASPVLLSAATVALSATSTSGLPVTFASSNPTIADVSGSTLNLNQGGAITVTASQAGDSNYNAATDVPQSLTITDDSTPITMEILRVVNAATYNSGTDTTSVTVEFEGVPDRTYQIGYSTDLSNWSTPTGFPTGTGTFEATFTSPGDVAAAWAAHLFFRATR